MTLTHKIVAGAAALTLTTGLVACSGEAGSGETSTVEVTATETAAGATGANESGANESGAASASGAQDGESVEVTTADGQTTLVPQGVSDAMKQYGADWGEPTAVEETANGWIVTYDDEHYVTWNQNTGGAPTWGEIANNWVTSVRTDSALGFPTAPEEALPDGSGWTQSFENGTIEWVRGADGIFSANVTQK